MNRLSACIAIVWIAIFWPMACLLADAPSCGPGLSDAKHGVCMTYGTHADPRRVLAAALR